MSVNTEKGDSGGNPAGVVLNADKLSDAQKLKAAQAVGYSETAFVSNDEVDFEVYFLPPPMTIFLNKAGR